MDFPLLDEMGLYGLTDHGCEDRQPGGPAAVSDDEFKGCDGRVAVGAVPGLVQRHAEVAGCRLRCIGWIFPPQIGGHGFAQAYVKWQFALNIPFFVQESHGRLAHGCT
jgi:hypothetical protein